GRVGVVGRRALQDEGAAEHPLERRVPVAAEGLYVPTADERCELFHARTCSTSAAGWSSGMNVRLFATSSKRPWGRSSASRRPCARGKILSPSAHRTSAGLSKRGSAPAAS